MPSLITTSGHTFEFASFPSRLGTDASCDIVVQPGLGIEGHHFTIQREGPRLVLVGRGRATIKVNGKEVRRASIGDGDIIDAGDLQLTFNHVEAVPGSADAPGAVSPSEKLPFDLEPIPSAELAHTPRPVGQGPIPPVTPGSLPAPPPDQPQPAATLSPAALPQPQAHPVEPAPQPNRPPTEPVQPVAMMPPGQQGTHSAAMPPNPSSPAETPANGPVTEPVPKPSVQQPPPEPVETVDFDWAAAAAEEAADGDDLAQVFWQDEPAEAPPDPTLEVPPMVEDHEIPSLPNIEEAEESGKAVKSREMHSKAINPIASKTMRRPNVPRAKRDVSTIDPSEAAKPDSGKEKARRQRRPAKQRRRWRKARTLEDRLIHASDQQTQRHIPWHKLAILMTLLFAGAGAWLATDGQDVAEQVMHRLGIQVEADHRQYLERFATGEPIFLMTMDADAWVSFYRECATHLDGLTISQINSVLAETTSAFTIDDIDRFTVGIDRKGQLLALISVKEALNKRRLLYDLSSGMSVPEKLPNNIMLHSGPIGRSHRMTQFAVLDEKTFVIGEGLGEFLSGEDEPLAMSGQNKQLLEIARSSTDSLGIYFKPSALVALRSKAPAGLHPYIDRLSEVLDFPDNFEFSGKISSSVAMEGSGEFSSATEAHAFATSLPALLDEQFRHLGSYLGNETATIDQMRKDLATMQSKSNELHASFSLSVPNRWLGTELQHLQDTVKMIANEMKSSRAAKADYSLQPELLSREESELRRLAKGVANEWATAMSKEAPKLQDVRDIDEVVILLARGVHGGGVYKSVKFRAQGIKDAPTARRVAKFLAWRDGLLIFSPYKSNEPRPFAANSEAQDGEQP